MRAGLVELRARWQARGRAVCHDLQVERHRARRNGRAHRRGPHGGASGPHHVGLGHRDGTAGGHARRVLLLQGKDRAGCGQRIGRQQCHAALIVHDARGIAGDDAIAVVRCRFGGPVVPGDLQLVRLDGACARCVGGRPGGIEGRVEPRAHAQGGVAQRLAGHFVNPLQDQRAADVGQGPQRDLQGARGAVEVAHPIRCIQATQGARAVFAQGVPPARHQVVRDQAAARGGNDGDHIVQGTVLQRDGNAQGALRGLRCGGGGGGDRVRSCARAKHIHRQRCHTVVVVDAAHLGTSLHQPPALVDDRDAIALDRHAARQQATAHEQGLAGRPVGKHRLHHRPTRRHQGIGHTVGAGVGNGRLGLCAGDDGHADGGGAHREVANAGGLGQRHGAVEAGGIGHHGFVDAGAGLDLFGAGVDTHGVEAVEVGFQRITEAQRDDVAQEVTGAVREDAQQVADRCDGHELLDLAWQAEVLAQHQAITDVGQGHALALRNCDGALALQHVAEQVARVGGAARQVALDAALHLVAVGKQVIHLHHHHRHARVVGRRGNDDVSAQVGVRVRRGHTQHSLADVHATDGPVQLADVREDGVAGAIGDDNAGRAAPAVRGVGHVLGGKEFDVAGCDGHGQTSKKLSSRLQ